MQITKRNNMFRVLKRLATCHPTNDKYPVQDNSFVLHQLAYVRTFNYACIHYTCLVLPDIRLKSALFHCQVRRCDAAVLGR